VIHGWRNEGGPIVTYGDAGDEHGLASFSRACPRCGRMVKADEAVTVDGAGQPRGDNATCAKCGRVAMPFVGYP